MFLRPPLPLSPAIQPQSHHEHQGAPTGLLEIVLISQAGRHGAILGVHVLDPRAEEQLCNSVMHVRQLIYLSTVESEHSVWGHTSLGYFRIRPRWILLSGLGKRCVRRVIGEHFWKPRCLVDHGFTRTLEVELEQRFFAQYTLQYTLYLLTQRRRKRCASVAAVRSISLRFASLK